MNFLGTTAALTAALLCALSTAHSATTYIELELIPNDPEAGDTYGFSTAISDTTAVVGAVHEDVNGTSVGSAYLFDSTTGIQTTKLIASDGQNDDQFGTSVAISGNTVIVGARLDDDNGLDSGSAYLFDATTGAELHKLTANDGAANDLFGFSAGLSGNTAIVGAFKDDDNGFDSGSAYLFDATTGLQTHKLTASDAAPIDNFGVSVDVSGTTAIVGAFLNDDDGSNSGSAYLFDSITGVQTHKLTASDAAANDFFGYSVAISGDLAIVGAYQDQDNGFRSGSAYVFDTTTGSQLAKLTANDGATNDIFGYSVAISGNTAIVGARDFSGTGTGSAYLFDMTTFAQITKLTASDAAVGDYFGGSVGISGRTAIVGAFGSDKSGLNAGAAYTYTPVPLPAAAWLLLGGVSALTALRRRKAAA